MTTGGFNWDRLIEYIQRGQVVPVVGRDMSFVDGASVDEVLGRAVWDSAPRSVQAPDEWSLSAVTMALLRTDPLREQLGTALQTALSAQAFPPPEPLVKLAEITDFQLFIDTTVHSLLADALDAVRGGSKGPARSVAFSPSRPSDLDQGWARDASPLIYHVFGQLSYVPEDYALTDEDMLEFLLMMQERRRSLPNLLHELQQRHLLMIGCALPGWLSRLLVRTLKNERLLESRTLKAIADDHVRGNDELVTFLSSYGAQVYAGGTPRDFVDELVERWKQAGAPVRGAATGQGTVFLSYAHEDAAAAKRVKQILEAAGLKVWFDESSISPAAAWEDRIERGLTTCDVFVAIISNTTESNDEGYFHREWNLAAERDLRFSSNARFLWPVVVDGLGGSPERVPSRFRDKQFVRAPGGELPPDVAAEVAREIESRTQARAER